MKKRKRIEELETICAELYQVIGTLLFLLTACASRCPAGARQCLEGTARASQTHPLAKKKTVQGLARERRDTCRHEGIERWWQQGSSRQGQIGTGVAAAITLGKDKEEFYGEEK